MEDTLRNTPPSQPRRQKHKNYRHLQTDHRSVGLFSDHAGNMPQNRLKTRVLGGQAETIMRTRGSIVR
jgi:hypothetical protein